MELEFNQGIVDDPRSVEDREKDYKHSDFFGDIVVNWKEKKTTEWKTYTPREQNGSLSCCGQSAAKAIETLNNEVNSAHPPYRSRRNFPDGGMFLDDLGKVSKGVGTTTEVLDVSQKLHESEMNRDLTVETPTKIKNYFWVNHKNIEEIAQAIELHKHCILIFQCNKAEWIDMPKYLGKDINFGHCVCAVDYFIYNGKKCILIEDSTGHFNSFDGNGLRLITEEFLQARCVGGIYFTYEAVKPKLEFTRFLKVGCVGDDVKKLQVRLGIGADRKFGQKTRQAVMKFQMEHLLVVDGVVGPLTINELNK